MNLSPVFLGVAVLILIGVIGWTWVRLGRLSRKVDDYLRIRGMARDLSEDLGAKGRDRVNQWFS